MSEQIIRAIASDYKANHNLEQAELCHCILCAGLRAAFSEPPDVVVLLRWLYDHMNIDNHMVVLWIREEFHIRLTDDDGWERVEE